VILVVRRLDKQYPVAPKVIARCLAAGAVISLIAARADFCSSRAVRELARQIATEYNHPPATLWFQGHWGFQYYMQQSGAAPMDFKTSPLKPGDILVVPSNNTNLRPPDPAKSALLGTPAVSISGPLAIMGETSGAGFYSSIWGPLPFALGPVRPEQARVFELKLPPVATPNISK
jgi:hypothetical protein